jgi:hypothetical protein
MGLSLSILSSQVSAEYPLRYKAIRAIWSVNVRSTSGVRRCNDHAVEKSRSFFKSFPENVGRFKGFMKLGVLGISGFRVVEAVRFGRTGVVSSIYIEYAGVSPASSISMSRISFSCLFSLTRIISAAYLSCIVGCTSSTSYSSLSLIADGAPAPLVSGCDSLPAVALALPWV